MTAIEPRGPMGGRARTEDNSGIPRCDVCGKDAVAQGSDGGYVCVDHGPPTEPRSDAEPMGNEPRVSDEELEHRIAEHEQRSHPRPPGMDQSAWAENLSDLARTPGLTAAARRWCVPTDAYLDLRDARAEAARERERATAEWIARKQDAGSALEQIGDAIRERDAARAQVAMLREALEVWEKWRKHPDVEALPPFTAALANTASADAFVARTRELALEPFLELDPHLGYEPDIDRDGRIDGWYCRSHQCTQPFGKPHLDACEIGPLLRPLAGQPSAEKLT